MRDLPPSPDPPARPPAVPPSEAAELEIGALEATLLPLPPPPLPDATPRRPRRSDPPAGRESATAEEESAPR
jgi:hypothetical protein